MISGTHKILVMKGVVEKGSDEFLRTIDLRDDIVPTESPLMSRINGDATVEEIFDALKQLTKASVGM
ncbi:hypothetical protein HS088_TW01G00408 [Tripterygium wilfordii]|uniref:Uncharacterized protein n=2 Tax=Tripterygium wilfordii TaxID=458696 RepID=A0A7J7E2G3_TRIWF|nr:hypothetical protein HS088_TW01G00408 [Tripterygium wilfordii]